MKNLEYDLLDRIAERAHYLAVQMIHQANHRDDVEKGDPKVGGHPAACASALHILGALHMVVRSGFDHIAVKPHASPIDHSYHYLLDLFLEANGERFSENKSNQAMYGLRAFSKNGEPVFQSYHSAYDSDHHNFLPSGTVGIPPVNLGYLAAGYLFAEKHGYNVPENAHFWALIGDSEFREGSLYEAIPDFAERQLGNLTWIIDYNRQSLDGHRITNKKIMEGTDADRIERTCLANGWHVIQVRHGSFREKLFEGPSGKDFKRLLELELEDYELQALLLSKDMKSVREELLNDHPFIKTFLDAISDEDLFKGLRDMGGHDFKAIIEALIESKKDPVKPTMVICHTIKGWGLQAAAAAGNHSSLPSAKEVDELREKQGLSEEKPFSRFSQGTSEGQFLRLRGDQLYSDIQEQWEIRDRNKQEISTRLEAAGEIPNSMDINLKMVNYPHTQWMLGQLTAKLTRIANTPLDLSTLKKGQKELNDFEKRLRIPGEFLVSMAPDVGTSTNLNPAMDGKVFSLQTSEDFEAELEVKDKKLPDLVPGDEESDRFLRFEIAEGNVMSCVGSFGKIRDILGIPLMPLMTIYDFFVKRALDQFFYDLYWNSSFILVGTPSGVTLSPEGAQHGWKSDIQIPNQITWEPFYCLELDWILCESIKRHFTYNNEGRTGVFIRGVTRGADQKSMLMQLRKHLKFKSDSSRLLTPQGFQLSGAIEEQNIAAIPDEEILGAVRSDVLEGGYYLVDYRGYAGYEPGENVVHIFSLGSPTTEAVEASNELLKKGIYANVIVVTCTDLLIGNLGELNEFNHLKNNLQINGDLYLQSKVNGSAQRAELVTLAGSRIPVVSVHDGEPGLLDNIGSIVGTPQKVLAVRQHSKCGRPSDVYKFHGIDKDSIIEAAGKALSEVALDEVKISRRTIEDLLEQPSISTNWKDLWSSNQG